MSIQKKFLWNWVSVSSSKSVNDAIKILKKKRKVVDANSDNIMASVEVSLRNTQAVHQAMQEKMMEIQARQRGVI